MELKGVFPWLVAFVVVLVAYLYLRSRRLGKK